ncbi:MAG: hypothetical protein M3077_10095 [Candidatus Dormibacteraeota bacterium]|nr:hypothetical protein [Candidatus Dormibacteraeota bacterium]
MDFETTRARLRATGASAGTLLLLGAALASYQLTSLTLGSPASRQFNLSLSTPTLELQDAASPFSGNPEAVLGERERGAAVTPRLAVTAPRATHAAPSRIAAASVPAPATRHEPAGKVPTATVVVPVVVPVLVPLVEPDTVTGSNYHDADVRDLRLARGRRPGSSE